MYVCMYNKYKYRVNIYVVSKWGRTSLKVFTKLEIYKVKQVFFKSSVKDRK